MKLYSFQRMHVWHNLNELGYYHPFDLFEHDAFLKDDLERPWGFAQSYQWLRQAMIQQDIQHYANNSHLIWSWYQWNGYKQPCPDKRYSTVYDYFSNEPYVMLELDIDPNRITLSDYDLWHDVLNYHYIGKIRESNRIEKIYNYYKYKGKILPVEGQALVESSWNTIFDMDKSRKILEINKKQQRIQATFFELFYTDITKVHFFEHKRCQDIKILKI